MWVISDMMLMFIPSASIAENRSYVYKLINLIVRQGINSERTKGGVRP